MKFIISKDTFLKGLQVVQSAIAAHSTIPILSNVHIQADREELFLTVTDMYLTMRCRVQAEIQKAGVTTLNARRLLSIIREMPQNSIEVDIDDKETANIRCGSAVYKLFGLSAEDYPPVPAFDAGAAYTIDQLIFKEMLKKTVCAVSNDESRQILNGIFLSLKDKKITMVSTDGRRLALAENELDIPENLQVGIVIPVKTVSEMIKCLKDEGTVKIQAQANMAEFDADEIKIVTKLIDGTYPNYQQVIPTRYEERITIEREGMLSALRRMSLMTNEKSPSVKVTIEKNQMQISATTPDVGEANETLPIKYDGKRISAAFNPEYLMDPLKNITSDEVYLEMVDDMSPAVIKCDVPFLYVVMPVRVN